MPPHEHYYISEDPVFRDLLGLDHWLDDTGVEANGWTTSIRRDVTRSGAPIVADTTAREVRESGLHVQRGIVRVH